MKLFPLFLAAATLIGCTHQPARTITLPTTAAIRAPIVVAQAHVTHSIQTGHREAEIASVAVNQGIVAGSAQAHELSQLIAMDSADKQAAQDQLSASLYRAGEMDRIQAAKQKEFDALARHDAAKTAEVGMLTKVLHRWKAAVILLVVGDYFAGAPIQSGLHWLVAFVGHWLLIAWRCIAIPLKTAFPLYLFWLPA